MTTEPALPAAQALNRARQHEAYQHLRRRCREAPTRTSGRGARTRSTSTAARAGSLGHRRQRVVDLRMGYGPVILGHADPRVDDYVNERMRRGVSFSLTSEDEVQAAELICELTFCEMARLTVSGTEATMHAMRVARGFTGRDRSSSSRASTTVSTTTR